MIIISFNDYILEINLEVDYGYFLNKYYYEEEYREYDINQHLFKKISFDCSLTQNGKLISRENIKSGFINIDDFVNSKEFNRFINKNIKNK